MAEELLRVESLTISIPTSEGVLQPVRDVSFELQRGGALAVVGETGAGKSMMGRAIMGLLRPPAHVSAGRIVFDGQDITSAGGRQRRMLLGARMSMVMQDSLSALNPVVTIGAQVGEVFRLRGGADRVAARTATVDLLERVGIADPARVAKSYPYELSGGMRQRVLIAIAIALKPQLIVADEPTTALDVSVQAQILNLLAELRATHDLTMILVTHDLGVVADIADDVAVMYAGKIAETGPTEDVFGVPAHPYTEGLLASVPSITARRNRQRGIEGMPPELGALPRGCAFAPRCPLVVEKCESAPDLRRSGDRAVACHRSDEVLRIARTQRSMS